MSALDDGDGDFAVDHDAPAGFAGQKSVEILLHEIYCLTATECERFCFVRASRLWARTTRAGPPGVGRSRALSFWINSNSWESLPTGITSRPPGAS